MVLLLNNVPIHCPSPISELDLTDLHTPSFFRRPNANEICARVAIAFTEQFQVEGASVGRTIQSAAERMWAADPLSRPSFHNIVSIFADLQERWAPLDEDDVV